MLKVLENIYKPSAMLQSRLTAESTVDEKKKVKYVMVDASSEEALPEHLRVQNPPWRAGLGNRFFIRAFTRGVLGAIGYAWGYHNGSKFFSGYDYDFDKGIGENWRNLKENDYLKGYNAKSIARKGVQGTALLIDSTVGKGMHALGKKISPNDYSWAEFRNTNPKGKRSLSKEMWGVTFDFAMSSTGDAIGDEIVNLLDPNHNTSWLKDGRINWKKPLENRIDLGKWWESARRSVWNTLTYRQGEDWIVALPYVYIARATTYIQNKNNPGWKYDFDSYNRNGASIKVNYEKNEKENGPDSVNVETLKAYDHYSRTGFVNLWARFWLYNDLTRKYREVYNALKLDQPLSIPSRTKEYFKNWAEDGYSLPSFGHVMRRLKATTRWAIGESIKSAINMIPTAAVFSAMRVQQRRDEGFIISEKEGALYKANKDIAGLKEGEVYSHHSLREHFGSDDMFAKHHKRNDVSRYRIKNMLEDRDTLKHNHLNREGRELNRHYSLNSFEFRELDDIKSKFGDRWFDTSGKVQWLAANTYGSMLEKLPDKWLEGLHIKGKGENGHTAKQFAREQVHAGLSYFPYFFAKSDWVGPKAYSETTHNWVDKHILTPVFGAEKSKEEIRTGIKQRQKQKIEPRASKEALLHEGKRENFQKLSEKTEEKLASVMA